MAVVKPVKQPFYSVTIKFVWFFTKGGCLMYFLIHLSVKEKEK